MKIVALGDIHGSDKWESIIKNTHSEKIIFLGDYVDQGVYSHKEKRVIQTVSDGAILYNLKNIIELKKRFPDKVILLLGNHDVQYFIPNTVCSGRRPYMAWDLRELFKNNLGLFQYAYQYSNFLFTHAGVSKHFYNKHIKSNYNIKDGYTIADAINDMGSREYRGLYEVGYARGGRHKSGGPLWLDKSVLLQDALAGYVQVVGHTTVKDIEPHLTKGHQIYFIDCINTSGKHLSLEI